MLSIGSLFSGIGGLELGLERAGLGPVIWQAESDLYCRRVLRERWPEAERFADVRQVKAGIAVPDLVCGGFPCQDVSQAGSGAGLDGERSGLWSEYARVIAVLRPRFVVVENVAALRRRGLGRVLGTLASCGYDATWDCIPAAAVGAPHWRDRLFVVAWRVSDADRPVLRDEPERGAGRPQAADGRDSLPRDLGAPLVDPGGERLEGRPERGECGEEEQPVARARREAMADPARERRRASGEADAEDERREAGRVDRDDSGPLANADRWGRAVERVARSWARDGDTPRNVVDRRELPVWPPGPDDLSAWGGLPAEAQPAVCSLVDGFPDRPSALAAGGNAVVVPVGTVVGWVVRQLLEDGVA